MRPILTLLIAFAIINLFVTCKDPDVPSAMPPKIFEVNPQQGCITDLPFITLKGTGFKTVKKVRIGNLSLTDGQFVVNGAGDELYIQPDVFTGQWSLGEYFITVESSDGLSEAVSFFINEECAPMLSELIPSTAQVGDTIVLSGKYFKQPDLKVFFTDANQSTTLETTFIVASETEIKAIVPDGCISGNIAVKNALGTSNTLTFQLLQANPEPPVISSVTGNVAGAVSRGCLLTVTGQHFVTQGTKLKIIQSGSVVAELQSADFEAYSDLSIKARIPGSLATGNTVFEVTTDYGTASANLPVQDYSMKAVDVLPASNYIGGPFLLNKQGGSINRILFEGLGSAAQGQFQQDGDYVASRVPSGIGAGQANVFIESNAGCYSNPLSFVVANGNSPWGGGISGNENIVIPNPPPGTSVGLINQAVTYKFAELTPAPVLYELNIDEDWTSTGDTIKIKGTVYKNSISIASGTVGRFIQNGKFIELSVDGKQYTGKIDDSYPPGTPPYSDTPNRFVLYPHQPGEMAELIFPYVIDNVSPSSFSVGDTITVTGKYFPQNGGVYTDKIRFRLAPIDGGSFGFTNYDCEENIWISTTSIKIPIVPCFGDIPPGEYIFSIGPNVTGFQSNGIPVTIQ